MKGQSVKDFKDRRESHWVDGLYRRGQSYRYKRRIGGKMVVSCFGRVPFDEAERKARRLNLDLEEGKDIRQVVEGSRKTFATHAEEWLQKKNAALGGSQSVQRYRTIIENFCGYLATRSLNSIVISDINYAICDDYVTHRRTAPIMPNGYRLTPKARKFTPKSACKNGAAKKTIYAERAVLKAVFKEAVQRKLITSNPWDDVVVKRPTKDEILEKHHPLTREECAALIAKAAEFDQKKKRQPRMADIITFAVNTGCREDEICKLEWTDVDFEQNLIRVRKKKVVETRCNGNEQPLTMEYMWKPKASQGDIPMNETVKALLSQLKEKAQSSFVFAERDGGSCRLRLLRLVQQAARKAKIEGRLRFHDLRHTFGTLLREQGVPLEDLKELMRHADIKETLLYAKPNRQASHRAIKLLEVK